MKNVLMILLVSFAFVLGTNSASAQYVDQETAHMRLKQELAPMMDQAPSTTATLGKGLTSTLRFNYYMEVLEDLPSEPEQYDEVINRVYDEMTEEGTNKETEAVEIIRQEIRQLLTI